MAADRIHIVHPAPPHCSSCYQQKPDQRHVDFEAAWDGPVLPALDGAVGVIGHSIDDLILCEDCIRIAAGLIGYQDVTDLIKARARLEETRDTLLGKVAALEEHNQHLRQAVTSGQQVERAMRPPALMPQPAASAVTYGAGSPQNAPKPPRAPRQAKPKPPARRQSAAAKAAAADGSES